MKPKHFALIIGALLIIGGLFLGFKGTTVQVAGKPFQCGSVFSANDTAQADRSARLAATLVGARKLTSDTPAADACAAASNPVIPWALIIAGAVTLLGAVVIRTEDKSQHGSR